MLLLQQPAAPTGLQVFSLKTSLMDSAEMLAGKTQLIQRQFAG